MTWWIPGLIAAVAGRAIGGELLNLRDKRKAKSLALVSQRERGSEHSKLIGPIIDAAPHEVRRIS